MTHRRLAATVVSRPQFDRVMRLEHCTSAAEQGAAAARNALDPQNATPLQHGAVLLV